MKETKTQKNAYFWLGLFILLCLFLYSVKDVLLPFVVAMIVAYFLDPAADKLEEIGLSRALSTTIITGTFFVLLVIAVLLLAPAIYNQFLSLAGKLPAYITYINEYLVPKFSMIVSNLEPSTIEDAKGAISSASKYVISLGAKILGNLLNSGIALVNIISLIFITPVVTFYMLRDWDKITDKISSLLPPKHKATIEEQIGKIDETLSGFLRGQTNVCLLLSAYYMVLLTIVGLEFGLFIGLATGMLTFIPYVGALFGFIVGVSVAFFQYDSMSYVAIVAAIFTIGPIIEGTFVSPKLVGDKVGLHPVWIMFGMLAGAAMFGFVGVLLALPVTSVIGVLVRFFVKQYSDNIVKG